MCIITDRPDFFFFTDLLSSLELITVFLRDGSVLMGFACVILLAEGEGLSENLDNLKIPQGRCTTPGALC